MNLIFLSLTWECCEIAHTFLASGYHRILQFGH